MENVRPYMMYVEIEGVPPDCQDAVICAADANWYFEDWKYNEERNLLWARGDDDLYGSETEEHFARRLAESIWEAIASYCRTKKKIRSVMTFL